MGRSGDDGARPVTGRAGSAEAREVRVTEIRAEMVANVWKVVAAEGTPWPTATRW